MPVFAMTMCSCRNISDVRASTNSCCAILPRRLDERERPSPHMQKQIRQRVLDGFAAEEVDEFDYEDDDYHQLEDEGAGLVELVDHESVEVFGGLELFFDQIFVVGDADFGGAKFVEARGEHVAEELDGVVGALGEFVDVEQYGVQFGRGARGAPARPEACAAGFDEVVDVGELAGEEFVVVAELEQLRVGVLQKLDGGLGAGGGVVDESGVPSDDREIVGIVRDARAKNFLTR